MIGSSSGQGREALTALVYESSDELLRALVELGTLPGWRGHRPLVVTLANAAAESFACIDCARAAMNGRYFSSLEALQSLAGARRTLGELEARLATCEGLTHLPFEGMRELRAKAKETPTLLLALNIAVRGASSCEVP